MGPLKAMSELVTPLNFSDGCVSETTCMFHVASWALNWPALRPTRGSGLGADVDMLFAGAGLLPPDAMEWLHAATDNVLENGRQRR